MKNNLEFYQHDSNSDSHPKFKMLRVKFGWNGEGKFWALNNRIAQAENCLLDLSKKYIKASVASDLNFNLEEFDIFIKYLMMDCELIKEVEPSIITTDRMQETFTQVQGNREKARDRKQKNLEKVLKSSGELIKSSGEPNNRSKVKESKVKERYKNLELYLQDKIIQNNFLETKDKIFEFFDYRNSTFPKKDHYDTEKKIDGLFRNIIGCRTSGLIASECLDIAMENGWKTPNPDYFKKNRYDKKSIADKNKQACQDFIMGAGNEE